MDMGTQGVRRLLRRTDGKMVAGVAAGLGDYFGVDPVWFRLGFVLFTFAGGAGLLAYIVLWVIMPESAAGSPSGAERGLERIASTVRGTPTWIGIALVVLGGILVVNAAVDWRPGVIWGFSLIVLGVLLFVQRDDRPAVDAVPAVPAIPSVMPPPPAPRIRERSTLGFMTMGALLVALGIVSLLDAQDIVTFEPVQYLAMALAIIGVGLLVGSVIGRGRWLIVPGLLLVPLVFATSLVHVPWEGGFGQRNYRVTGTPSLAEDYHIIAGEMTIDLSDAVTANLFRVEATAVAGRIVVIVPRGIVVDIEAKVGGGEIDLFGQTDEGVNVEVHKVFGDGAPMTAEPQPGGLSLELDIEAGFGRVEVRS